MGTLIYSMITSLDGYAVAAEGDLGAGAEDQEVHTYIGDLFRGVRTFLYGRRMYETMVFWETAHTDPAAPPHIVEYARDWQAADKIVYSTTLESVPSRRTRIERAFDPEAIIADQSEVPGTGSAVLAGLEALDAQHRVEGTVVVTYGDVPLLTPDTLADLVRTHQDNGSAVTVLTAQHPEPGKYGRILRDADGSFADIREFKDATEAERALIADVVTEASA